jgi:hypothetical protein
MRTWQSDFTRALRDPDWAVPAGVTSHNSDTPQQRFAIYRNNVMVGLVSALEARFPAIRKIVGEDFLKGAAKLFATTQPPRSPLMLFYGDAFPAFLADFEPAGKYPISPTSQGLKRPARAPTTPPTQSLLRQPRSPALPSTPWPGRASRCTPRLKSSRRTIRSLRSGR